jgi:hypothetical protein
MTVDSMPAVIFRGPPAFGPAIALATGAKRDQGVCALTRRRSERW